MLIRLISTNVHKPFSQKTKATIDKEIKKYRDSAYWDHAFTIFYEKSVAQNHAEAIKEWILVPNGYEYYPEGRTCDLHNASTKNIYILRNQLNGNELRVGEGCAASHSLPLEFKTYSPESFKTMLKQEKAVRLTSMRALSRSYFEKHQGDIEDMLDLAVKYRGFIYAKGAGKDIAALKDLYSKYKSAKSTYEGQRENMIYWHRSELKRLGKLLEPVYAALPWLKTYSGFERKMRTLWNYRQFLNIAEQKELTAVHKRWKCCSIDPKYIRLSQAEADKMMQLYNQLLSSKELLEIDIAKDGQLRLTLRYLYGYQDLLDEKTRQIYGLVLDAFKFLQLREPKNIEQIQKTITIQVINTELGPKPADFSVNGIHTQLNKMFNGLWQGTHVISQEDKRNLETVLADIRTGRITKNIAREQDPEIEQKITTIRIYGLLLGKQKQQKLLKNIERWDSDNVYTQVVQAIQEAYTELCEKKITLADFDKYNPNDATELSPLNFIAKYTKITLPEYLALHAEKPYIDQSPETLSADIAKIPKNVLWNKSISNIREIIPQLILLYTRANQQHNQEQLNTIVKQLIVGLGNPWISKETAKLLAALTEAYTNNPQEILNAIETNLGELAKNDNRFKAGVINFITDLIKNKHFDYTHVAKVRAIITPMCKEIIETQASALLLLINETCP